MDTNNDGWVEDFRKAHGRVLRVLHLGNVANNAFFNAKFLNRAGLDCDVLCSANYHIMSSPEWEEADFSVLPRDLYFPDWEQCGVVYERPRHFAQGPLPLAVEYLLARRRGEGVKAEALWERLETVRRTAAVKRGRLLPAAARRVKEFLPARTRAGLSAALQNLGLIHGSRTSAKTGRGSIHEGLDSLVGPLQDEFLRRFPLRPDRLTRADCFPFLRDSVALAKLKGEYDLIHAYGTDAILPLLSNARPYVAYEHGTLRDIPGAGWDFKGPFFNNGVGRLTALGYALADHVLVTNADTIGNARRLGIERFSPIGHPVDGRVFGSERDAGQVIRAKFGDRFLLVCPIRHDWLEKGTDVLIRAIPGLRKALGRGFVVCFMPWGKEVERSRRLIAELGCAEQVRWVGPFGQISFARWLMAADVVLDQVAFPSFSGITPRALAAGVPVIARYDPAVMEWMFPDQPPVLSASTADEVTARALEALRPGFRELYRRQAQEWFGKYHSEDRVRGELIGVYRRVLSRAATAE